MWIINDIEADTANLNADTARLSKIRATYQNLTVMADIIMGNSTNDYTFRQVAKAFDEVASDYSLNISDRSRQVYKTISQAYAQWNTPVQASDEIKQAFLDFINAVRPKIEAMQMPTKDKNELFGFLNNLNTAINNHVSP